MHKNNKQLNEEGIVSIVITLIIMIILSLIVTGFAQLARREQREALDRQLSAQANYAAESGINAFIDVLPNINVDLSPKRESCDQNVSFKAPIDQNKNPFDAASAQLGQSGSNSSYTCLLYDTKPETLIGSVSTDSVFTVPLSTQTSDGLSANLQNLTLSWVNNANGSSAIRNGAVAGQFPNKTTWGSNNVGALRVDLIPLGVLSQDTLDSATKTFILYPVSSGQKTKDKNDIGRGDVIGVQCSNECKFTVTNLDKPNYILRVKSLYTPSKVTINSNSAIDGTGTPNKFVNAQVEVDSTGKATDVLKRIKVRLPFNPKKPTDIAVGVRPDYVLSSNETICKKMELTASDADSRLNNCQTN